MSDLRTRPQPIVGHAAGPAPAAPPLRRPRHRAGGSVARTLPVIRTLEAESITVIREVVAETSDAAILFSGGKDSVLLVHLAMKAFAPAPLPVPLLHVDTGRNFPEVLAFRDRFVQQHGLRLLVASVPDALAAGTVQEAADGSRNRAQTPVLLEAVRRHGFDALLGGARRDEERSRAKERVVSFRDTAGRWDPEDQRPELWRLLNARTRPGESVRAFPLSDWTELDVWTYLAEEGIAVAPLYFAAEREVVDRGGMLYAVGGPIRLRAGESASRRRVRYRTLGDADLTAAVESDAADTVAVVAETASTRRTERGATRADDRAGDAAMEDRKREGYF